MRPPVENPAVQDKLQYVAMRYYEMVDDYSPPYRHQGHLIPDHARVAQDIPTQTHVTPPAPVCTDLT